MIIEIDHIKYHIKVNGTGKPVIFLHGFSENLDTWELIKLEGYQQIRIDLIGHGKSDKPHHKKYYTLKRMLKDLHSLILQLGLTSYYMAGYSMGGRIALAYTLAYPKEVEGLVLESASYGECGLINRFKRRRDDKKLAKRIRNNGVEWFEQYWSSLSIFKTQKALPQTMAEQISKRRLSNAPYALSYTLLSTGQGNFPCLINKIPRLSTPVLYICGEMDHKYQQIGNALKSRSTKIKKVIIEGAGHNTHLEKPEAFLWNINKFLGDIKHE